MIQIIIHGCQGKMGRAVASAAMQHPGFDIAFGVDRNQGAAMPFSVHYPISQSPPAGDVIIDFSSHDAVPEVLDFALSRNLPLVLASTGLTGAEMEMVREASLRIPIFQSPNFSIGINLLAACVRQLMPVLEHDFDAAIIDKHHKEKKDLPSGTALLLADVAKNAGSTDKPIQVIALRAGTIPGEHTVIFAGPDEIIELKHTALSRDIFARGALKAAEFLVGKPPGAYNMNDLIERN